MFFPPFVGIILIVLGLLAIGLIVFKKNLPDNLQISMPTAVVLVVVLIAAGILVLLNQPEAATVVTQQ